MSCIYMWTNNVNKKRYIGQCRGNVKRRYNEHISGHGSQPLKNAIDKHGIENFTFEILHDRVSDEFLDDREKEAIKEYNTLTPNGYNLTHGGEGPGIPSEETRCKMSKAKAGENHPNYGKTRSEETRRKISEAQMGEKNHRYGKAGELHHFYGKTVPSEVRRKISNSLRGKPLSAKHRQSISEGLKGEKNPNYGRTLSQEHRHNLSKARKGMKFSEQHRHNNTEARRKPEYNDAYDFFCALPTEMSIQEKRKRLYAKYPKVLKDTIRQWIRKWLTNTTA